MSARQVAEPQTANANADKMFYVISERFEHAANLTIDSLSQDDAQADGRHRVESRNSRSLTVEKNATQQFRGKSWIPWPIQCHFVFLFDFVTRMSKPLCQI